jgi:PAS domain S-box-containing protein
VIVVATDRDLELENANLRDRIQVLQATLRAITIGEIDALDISDARIQKVLTLQNAENLANLLLWEQSARHEAEMALQKAKAELEMKVAGRTSELTKTNLHLHRSIGILEDVIKRQQDIDAQLREAERRWRSLLDNVQLLVAGLDSTGKVEYLNPFFLKLTGYTQDEILGKDWIENCIPSHQQQDVRYFLAEMLQHELHLHYQNYILTKSGEERLIAWNHTMLRDSKGRIVGIMSIGEDITQRYALDKIKDEFISVVSHELRTPLTSIYGGLNLLTNGLVPAESEKGKRLIQITSENAERLVRLVNDILDLERLQSGKVILSKHKVDTNTLLTKAAEIMQFTANSFEIQISIITQSIEVFVDSDRIIQVLTNLLSNAIKFSPENSIITMIAEKVIETKDCLPVVLFKVQDQGRGIPSENLETIFERFHQVDATDSRKHGGTGLGLAICRSIIEQHDGKIWVDSQIDVGSTFFFTIPLL